MKLIKNIAYVISVVILLFIFVLGVMKLRELREKYWYPDTPEGQGVPSGGFGMINIKSINYETRYS